MGAPGVGIGLQAALEQFRAEVEARA